MDDRHLEPVGRFKWEKLVRSVDTTATVKLVALMLATYGDQNGLKLRPGVARLAADCGLGERATRAALGTLRDLGLLERTVTGSTMGSRATTDEHRLTSPVELNAEPPPPAPHAGGQTWDGVRPAAPRADGQSRPPASEARPPASDDTTTGTTCTPSSSDHVYTKSSSWRAGDDLAQTIADEQSWPLPHARRVVADVLGRGGKTVRSAERYVLAAVRRDPGQFGPPVTLSRRRPGAEHAFKRDPDGDPSCRSCGLPFGNEVHLKDPQHARAYQ